MRIATLVICCGSWLMLLCGAPSLLPQTAMAQGKDMQSPASPSQSAPTDKFSIVSQVWHRFTGLAVADITFRNANDYIVRNALISYFEEKMASSDASGRHADAKLRSIFSEL